MPIAPIFELRCLKYVAIRTTSYHWTERSMHGLYMAYMMAVDRTIGIEQEVEHLNVDS